MVAVSKLLTACVALGSTVSWPLTVNPRELHFLPRGIKTSQALLMSLRSVDGEQQRDIGSCCSLRGVHRNTRHHVERRGSYSPLRGVRIRGVQSKPKDHLGATPLRRIHRYFKCQLNIAEINVALELEEGKESFNHSDMCPNQGRLQVTENGSCPCELPC